MQMSLFGVIYIICFDGMFLSIDVILQATFCVAHIKTSTGAHKVVDKVGSVAVNKILVGRCG